MKMWLVRLVKNLKKDSRNMTLHGFLNISESKSLPEMFFWIGVQLACFGLCLWLMTIHWLRYESRPTVTTIKSTAYPIAAIPFPAVTVCNSNVVYKKNTRRYQELLTKEEIKGTLVEEYFKSLRYLVHFNTPEQTDMNRFKEIETILSDLEITQEKLMMDLAHPCSAMIKNCTWANSHYNCTQLFRLVKTGLGYCCSFNYFNDESQISDNPAIFKKPIAADGAGMTHGLYFELHVEANQYLSTILPFSATFVIVHPISDYSDLSAFSSTMQPGDFTLMQLIPTIYTSDDILRGVAVQKRNCWFENEGHLYSGRNYSFANCVAECKAKAIVEFCKCVPYFAPITGDHSYCTLQDVACLKRYELYYNNIHISEKLSDNITVCNCLPQCQDVSYDGYVNSMRFSIAGNISMVEIYFDQSWCVEYGISLNLTWDMLLASLGGIFGLCLGGSLISLVEIVFYVIKSLYLAFAQGRQIKPSGSFQRKNNSVPRLITVSQKY